MQPQLWLLLPEEGIADEHILAALLNFKALGVARFLWEISVLSMLMAKRKRHAGG